MQRLQGKQSDPLADGQYKLSTQNQIEEWNESHPKLCLNEINGIQFVSKMPKLWLWHIGVTYGPRV